MSGYTLTRGGGVTFGLTATKGDYWHRHCGCSASTLEDLWRVHLEPMGFQRLRSPSPNLLVVTRADLVHDSAVFSAGPVFEALQPPPAVKSP